MCRRGGHRRRGHRHAAEDEALVCAGGSTQSPGGDPPAHASGLARSTQASRPPVRSARSVCACLRVRVRTPTHARLYARLSSWCVSPVLASCRRFGPLVAAAFLLPLRDISFDLAPAIMIGSKQAVQNSNSTVAKLRCAIRGALSEAVWMLTTSADIYVLFQYAKVLPIANAQSGTSTRCNISGFGLMITCMTRITSTVLWTMLDLETLERMQVYLFHWNLLAAFVGRLVVSQSSTIQASSWSSRTAFLTNFIVSIPSIMPYYTHHSRPFPTHKSRTTMVSCSQCSHFNSDSFSAFPKNFES